MKIKKYDRALFLAALSSILVFPATAVAQDYQLPVMTFSKDSDGFYTNRSDKDYVDYMWQTFVAINWPSQADNRGEPDTSYKHPAAGSPVVWQTYAQPQEALLPSSYWDDYPSWNKLPHLPAGMTQEALAKLCDGFDRRREIALYDINQPGRSVRKGPVAPLQDQFGRYVRYQVTLNKTFFNYFRDHQYYNADVQSKAVAISEDAQYSAAESAPQGGFVPIPVDQKDKVGMLETKAAWRILDSELDDPKRYYTQPAVVVSPDKTSCERGTAALVALHIHRITRLSHVAATFEQIDNIRILDPFSNPDLKPSFNPGTRDVTQANVWPPYGNRGFDGNLPPVITGKDTLASLRDRQPVNISRATEIPLWLQLINRTYQEKYQDSPLAYYQLVNTQHVARECRMKETGNWSKPQQWQPQTCPYPNTRRLINAALESYTQLVDPFTSLPENYSCQSCHANARPCGIMQEDRNLLAWRSEFQVMSFLLGKAWFPAQLISADGYSCNIPQTQPPLSQKRADTAATTY